MISTGDLVRHEIKQGSDIGKRVKKLSEEVCNVVMDDMYCRVNW